MNRYPGFPDGVRLTPLPDPLFNRLLAEIDDFAELKLILRACWLLSRERSRPKSIAEADLLADPTLLAGVRPFAVNPQAALREALTRAAARGVLLRTTDPAGPRCLLNNPANRRILEAAADVPDTSPVPPAPFPCRRTMTLFPTPGRPQSRRPCPAAAFSPCTRTTSAASAPSWPNTSRKPRTVTRKPGSPTPSPSPSAKTSATGTTSPPSSGTGKPTAARNPLPAAGRRPATVRSDPMTMENLSSILKRIIDPNRESAAGAAERAAYRAAPPAPPCPECQGAGWVTKAVPVGHPDFGEAFPCPCRRQPPAEAAAARRDRSNLGPLARIGLQQLNPDGPLPDPVSQRLFRQAYQAAREFAAQLQGWLAFAGPSGCARPG